MAPVVAPVLLLGQRRRSTACEQVVRPLREEEMEPKLLKQVEFFKDAKSGTLGVIPNSVRTMAHRPEIASAFVTLNMSVMKCHGEVTYEFKRLLGYATSLKQGCNY